MISSISPVTAVSVQCTHDELITTLADGRKLHVPIVWFPRLAQATDAQRAEFELLGGGEGIHWSQIDEDISVAGLLKGKPSFEFGR